MITKFKLFENHIAAKSLSQIFTSDEVEKYYDDNYEISAEEVVEYAPSYVEDCIDNDRFVQDTIDDYINSYTWSEYDEYQFKDYIKDNITDSKEDEIIKLYKEENDIKDESIFSKTSGTVKISKDKNDNYIITITTNDKKSIKYKIPENHEILVEDDEYVNSGIQLSQCENLEYDDSMLDDLNIEQL